MKHSIYSATDSGQLFQESWNDSEVKSYIKNMMSNRGVKPYAFDVATRIHNKGEATEIDVISKKTGKISQCYLAYMFGSFHCEPNNDDVFVA